MSKAAVVAPASLTRVMPNVDAMFLLGFGLVVIATCVAIIVH